MHDSHVHLELLLHQLGYLPEPRSNGIAQLSFDHAILDALLENHDWVIQAGISTQNFVQVHSLLGYNPKIHFLLGSHPEIVDEVFDVEKYLKIQQQLVLNLPSLANTIVGIGEIGLDYHYTQDKAILKKQEYLFRSQLELATHQNLCVIIHSRDAAIDTLNILQQYPTLHGKILWHCFVEDEDILQKALDMGSVLGLGGIITYNSGKNLCSVIQKHCPIDRIILETDLPFLSPTPYRGKICLPNYIEKIAEKVAEIYETTSDTIWNCSQNSATKLFGSL